MRKNRSLDGWKTYLNNNLSIDSNLLWNKIKNVVAKSLISVEHKIRPLLEENCPDSSSCFQMLGTDIDVDNDLNVWLIESNVNPTINSKLVFERDEKFTMLKDMFVMLKLTNNSENLKNELKEIRER